MFLSGGPLILWGVGANGEAQQVIQSVRGGSSRRRRHRRRSEEDLIRQAIVDARQISHAPKEAMAVALSSLDVPPRSDIAMATTQEIARLIRRAQKQKAQEEEELMMVFSEIE